MASETLDIEIDLAAEFGASRVEGQRFAIYIPSKDRWNNDVAQEKWVEEALRLLSEIGGGATAMPPVRGAWLDDQTNQLIFEEPVVVYSFIEPNKFRRRLPDLVDFVKRIGRETNQGEVAFEFDGVFYLVSDFSG